MGKESSVEIFGNKAFIRAGVSQNATEREMYEALRRVGLENDPSVSLTLGPLGGVGQGVVTLTNGEDDSFVMVLGVGKVEK